MKAYCTYITNHRSDTYVFPEEAENLPAAITFFYQHEKVGLTSVITELYREDNFILYRRAEWNDIPPGLIIVALETKE